MSADVTVVFSLDRAIAALEERDAHYELATATSSPPGWLERCTKLDDSVREAFAADLLKITAPESCWLAGDEFDRRRRAGSRLQTQLHDIIVGL